jgi:hypothetical protein
MEASREYLASDVIKMKEVLLSVQQVLLKNRGRWPLVFFVVLQEDKRVIICHWLLLPSLSLLIKNLADTNTKKEMKTQDTMNTNDEM